jgi:cell division protein FtsB
MNKDNGEYDIKGAVVETIKFMPATSDRWSGKNITTGYTRITEKQYEGLVKSSRTWQVYGNGKGGKGFLVVHDDVPAELKTPHEAIRDARKALTKSDARVKQLEAEIADLKAKLFDAERMYRELSSASSGSEMLKLLNDKIADLDAEIKVLGDEKAELAKQLSENRPAEDKTVELTNKIESLINLNSEFVGTLRTFVTKDKKAVEALDTYTAKFAEFIKGIIFVTPTEGAV